jgi:S-DNA-T family DNA segregation ATPase FtsK/SpoIIIE
MPRIICVFDEYTDLFKGREAKKQSIEQEMVTLLMKASFVGIHLFISTRHTTRHVVKGILDVYLPSRIGFQMITPVESSLLLNQNGAEHLLGSGDLLYRDVRSLQRLQAPFMSPEDRARIFGI